MPHSIRPRPKPSSPPRLAQRVAAAAAACVMAPAGFSAASRFVGFAPRSLLGPRLDCDAPARQLDPAPRTSAYSPDADGLWVGGDGFAYDPKTTALADVPGVRPHDVRLRTGETMLYVNGAWTPPEQAQYEMELLANHTGHDVVGVLNATGGVENPLDLPKDALQAAGDKLGVGANPAAGTVADALCQAVQARRKLHVVGHSQGAATVARALFEVDAHLAAEQGLTQSVTPAGRAARKNALSVLDVRTSGGVGHVWPDGPAYTHLQNRRDPLTLLGTAPSFLEATGLVHAGAGAKRVVFEDGGAEAKALGYPAAIAAHVVDTYAPHLEPDLPAARKQQVAASVARVREAWFGTPAQSILPERGDT